MDLKELSVLSSAPENHWYYRSKVQALLRTIRHLDIREILDIGAGDGFFSRQLLLKTEARRACCVDTGYTADRDESIGEKTQTFRRAITSCEAVLVLAMDVLEHVPDDVALLRPYIAAVAPGTHFLVTVPAFSFLWSSHDVFLGHYRRYTLRQLEHSLTSAGLVVDRGCYFYAGVFPAAAALRLAEHLLPKRKARSQLHKHNPWVNRLLYAVCAIELPLMRINRLFGLTAMALAHKP